MPSVLLVRGHQATPWELAPWQRLDPRFSVRFLRTRSNAYDVSGLELEPVDAPTLRDRLPRGRVGDLVARVLGDRYTDDAAFAAADIVHAEELGYWFSAEAARRRLAGGRFKLVLTAWETLPMLGAYRNGPPRKRRVQVLEAGDLYLAATERARDALLLEGVSAERIEVCPPGIDVERFAVPAPAPPSEHLILSAGRLTWEKGHHDVLRAAAALHRGLIPAPALPRVLIVGAGAEGPRLRAHADELGIGAFVEVRPFVPYEEMPALYAGASSLVLASLPSAGMGLHAFDVPRAFWEEQFGMVLAEAMAAGLHIVASDSGAIPEVLDGQGRLVPAGDWRGLAAAFAEGPLAREPGARVAYPEALVRRYSLAAMAGRLEAAYDRVLAIS
jgi:glycosyltransferase involved in cell wall biosynthesis